MSRDTNPYASGQTRLPLQPLLDVLPIDRTRARADVTGPGVLAQASLMLQISTRRLQRYHHEGLDPWTADELAIAAGWHPLLVWGQDWIDAVASEAQGVLSEERGGYALSSPSP
jgi:hypothetical protein